MDTYFAAPSRATARELADEIRMVSTNPVVSGLLHTISGLVAILDEHRQIVAVNDSLLQMLGIDDAEHALGLRPGEALNCIHAEDEPAGCGTGLWCTTCDAAISIVACLSDNIPAERICALSARRAGKLVDLALQVQCQPIHIEGRRFAIILLQDISVEQRRAALERTFFHDVNNMLSSLIQASDLLVEQCSSELAKPVYDMAWRLYKEVAIQHSLSTSGSSTYRPTWHKCKADQIITELQRFFGSHPAANQKQVEFLTEVPDIDFTTDVSALQRVISNMILNALEATPAGGLVKMWINEENNGLVFKVWNDGVIPDDIARRIFQRNFSTKAQAGRGIGTYSMKLLGEEVLGGAVSFTSNQERGTVFRLAHPMEQHTPKGDIEA
jgi:signal transduction histidine kinase